MIICERGSHLGQKYPLLVEQMYHQRARLFHDRRGWNVMVREGKERDQFDGYDPLYVLVTSSDAQTLLASLRLLPTTGPHMLADVFSQTMSGAPLIRSPLVWESSRFCVDTQLERNRAANGLSRTTSELLIGLFEIALSSGLQNIVSVYDLYLERILRRAGCVFDRLGDVCFYDGLPTVAGLFEVSPAAIAAIRARSGIKGDAPKASEFNNVQAISA